MSMHSTSIICTVVLLENNAMDTKNLFHVSDKSDIYSQRGYNYEYFKKVISSQNLLEVIKKLKY